VGGPTAGTTGAASAQVSSAAMDRLASASSSLDVAAAMAAVAAEAAAAATAASSSPSEVEAKLGQSGYATPPSKAASVVHQYQQQHQLHTQQVLQLTARLAEEMGAREALQEKAWVSPQVARWMQRRVCKKGAESSFVSVKRGLIAPHSLPLHDGG
jgi:hypothetical protein